MLIFPEGTFTAVARPAALPARRVPDRGGRRPAGGADGDARRAARAARQDAHPAPGPHRPLGRRAAARQRDGMERDGRPARPRRGRHRAALRRAAARRRAGGPPRRRRRPRRDVHRRLGLRRRGARGRDRGPPSAADPAAPVVRPAPAGRLAEAGVLAADRLLQGARRAPQHGHPGRGRAPARGGGRLGGEPRPRGRVRGRHARRRSRPRCTCRRPRRGRRSTSSARSRSRWRSAAGPTTTPTTAAMEHVRRTGATYVHAFDDPRTAAGQGTAALEIADALPSVGTVVVPVGGGGLIAGDGGRAQGAACPACGSSPCSPTPRPRCATRSPPGARSPTTTPGPPWPTASRAASACWCGSIATSSTTW